VNLFQVFRKLLVLPLLTLIFRSVLSASPIPPQTANQQPTNQPSPSITKVEPPSWWIGLTPEVMLLLSGRNLQATHVSCNLPTLRVTHTQATAAGNYLFVWLKIPSDTRSGTAVCHVTAASGEVSFELPLASRESSSGKFQGLSQSDVIYLIMPDRFANDDPGNDRPADFPDSLDRANPRAYHGGDLRGIREHLTYLKDLGVTALWLTPIVKNRSAEDYHGYGAVDLYAVDPHLGTLQDYRELIASAHHQGMKVFFDIVLNHIGPGHPWVSDPPLPDWFHGTREAHLNSAAPLNKTFYGAHGNEPHSNKSTPNNFPASDPFETLVDPHAVPSLSRNLTDGWFADKLPDLNTENPVVARYLLQNSIWWAEKSGLDGYRLDTFPYVPRAFWSNWHAGLRRIYPNLATIGEVFHPDPSVTAFFAGGQKRFDGVDSGVTTIFDFPLYFALRDVLLRGAPLGKLTDVLRHDSLYTRADSLITFFANHDVARFAGAETSSLAKQQLAFALILTLRGIPQLYYGDEIGMTGDGDPDNRRDFPGGWPGDPRNAFSAEGRTAEEQKLFSCVQTLLRLRNEHPVLARGRLWHLASDDSAYVFLRDSEEEKIVVALNISKSVRDIKVSLNDTPLQGAAGAASLFGEATGRIVNSELLLQIPPQSLAIFRLD
jgi:glycosidase